MVSKFLKTTFLFSLLFWAFTAFAQPVQVSVALAPPYPVHLEDYAQMKGQIIVTLVNTSQTFLQLRLVPSVKGQNGISATLKPGYRPPTPLTLGPLETKVLTGAQLQSLNMGISLENMDIKGANIQQIIRTETLPEGLYDLCVRAFDFSSNTQLSKDGTGCSMFNITWYDPPVIIQPADKAQVLPLNPQFLNIGWTPSGLAGVTRYRLLMMDMTANGLANPNDAFDMGFPPFFQKEYLITLGYPLASAEPPLTVGHKYALRVQAYDPQGNLKFKNDGKSAVSTFTYGLTLPAVPGDVADDDNGLDIPFGDLSNPNTPQYNVPDPNDPLDCAAAFEVAMPSAATQYTPVTGDTVVIGKFKMRITAIAGGTGEGEIYMAFLKTKVKVKFENLQVNGQKQAYGSSKAWVNIDKENLVEQAMANDPSGTLNNVKVKDINDYVNNANKKVSKFIGEQSQPIGVPFALDNDKGQNLVLLGIIFTATKAQANLVYGMPIPEAVANDWFQLGTKGVGIRPNGFGLEGGKISLASDKSVALTDQTNFLLYSGANKTYLEFDCKGIKKLQLDGGIEFSREKALPLNAQSAVVAAPAKLVAKFSIAVDNPLNWTAAATLSHPKFALPQLEDIVFSAQNLMIDQSSSASVPNMKFPANHPKKDKADWRGVYLGNCTVTLPTWMKGKDAAAVSVVDLKDLLLDKNGLWVKVTKIGEIVKLGEGDMSGWGFSLDTLRLDVQASQLAGAGIGGKIRVPITKVGLGYSATIAKGNPNADFSFSVKTDDEITVDAFIAKATLEPNSWLKIERENGKYRPEAVLHGAISVGWEEDGDNAPEENNSVASFELPTLNFSDFHIKNDGQGKPKILNLYIEFDKNNIPKSDQHNLAGFPLKLGGLEVQTQGELKLAFGLDITLSKGDTGKNGLSGSAGFSIYGKYDEEQKLFVYDRTELDSIGLDMDIAVAHVVGGLWMYEGNKDFGNGFKGSITATIKSVGTKVSVTLQVGNIGKDDANFDYFYFDGLVQFGGGFQIPGTMASIYGFGGGVWYNMTRGELPKYSFADYKKDSGDMSAPGSSPTGVKFTPQEGSAGFSAKVIFGLSGGQQAAAALNGDLEFRILLKDNFSLHKMELEGHGYAMQKIDDRGNAKVEGTFKIVIDFQKPAFTMGVSLAASIKDIVKVDVFINMHFSPEEWFIKIGEWDTESQLAQDVPWEHDLKRCGLQVDLKVASAKVRAYFMMGSKMPELPPLPLAIRSRMVDQQGKPVSDGRIQFPEFDGDNPGFAFGVAGNTHMEVKALILYASLDFTLGFDVLLKKYSDDQICEGSSLGINNWYAQGQAYAQLGISAGIDINLFVWEGKWELFYVEATAALYGSFPNPNYFRGTIAVHGEALNGLVKVDKSFEFETGKKPCINTNPFGDYPIVSDMNPRKMEGKKDKVQVYQNIQLAFNFPKGEFVVWNDSMPEVPPRTCYYKIEEFSVKHGNKSIAFNPIEYAPDGLSARYVTKDEYFPANSTLKFHLMVKGYVKGQGAKTEEKYDFDFTTGKAPTKIVTGNLYASNPLPNQRFFLKNENGGEGYLKWRQGFAKKDKDVFKNTDDDGGLYDLSKTKFYACFTELKTGKRLIENFLFKPDQDILTFSIPAGLKNNTIYSLEFIKEMKTFPKPVEDDDMGGGGGWGQGGGNDQDGWEYQSGQFSDAEWKKISEGAYRVNRKLKPDTSVHVVRNVLFALNFKTSKFNRLSDKMATYSVKANAVLTEELNSERVVQKINGNNITYEVNDKGKLYALDAVLFMSGDENFDQYDAYGYTASDGFDKDFNVVMPPLVKFEASAEQKFPTFMYEQYMITRNNWDDIYIDHVEAPGRYAGSKIITTVPALFPQMTGISQWSPYIEFWRNGKWGSVEPYRPNGVQVTLPAPPLSKQEIDAAKAEAPQLGGGNIGHIVMNVNQQQGNGFQLPGLGLANAGKACIPVIDYSSSLAARDFRWYMDRGWGRVRTQFDYPSRQSCLAHAYDYMQPYISPVSGKTYEVIMGGKLFSYKF